MSDLHAFAKCLEELLALADREAHWEPGEFEAYMAAVADRRERFQALAARLHESVIQPRLEMFAGYFPNASLNKREPAGHCSCRFGYTERFPASTKVAFAIEHDVRFKQVAVCYEASMTPTFIKLNENDRLTLPLEAVEDQAVADWVEERLLEFLDAYLRIDRGGEALEEEVVTDPVCGMRIRRSSAAASDTYYGHPYFFCSSKCQEVFASEPTAYVEVRTM